jgi:hypothetical protein
MTEILSMNFEKIIELEEETNKFSLKKYSKYL